MAARQPSAEEAELEEKEEHAWRWNGQRIDSTAIDEEKKKEALAACHAEHAEFIHCMKRGFFANCTPAHKDFWDCYARHRGVKGNKFMAWLAPPPVRATEEQSGDTHTARSQHSS